MNAIDLFTLLTQLGLFFLIISLIFSMSPITLVWRFYDQIVRNFTGAPVVRLSRITPQLYVGGQHRSNGWERMQNMGITAIVNLREANYDDLEQGIAPERYLHLPTVDNTPPSLEDLQTGVAFIVNEIARGGQVYVHCASGVGRAPTLAAAYLISTGLTPREALKTLRKVRPFIAPRSFQKKQLELFATEYNFQGESQPQ